MPKTPQKTLDKKAAYNRRPDVQKKRVANNKARREAIADGRAKKGDGTHVDHVKPLDKGGSAAKSNTRVVKAAKNKAWRKDHPGMYTKRSK